MRIASCSGVAGKMFAAAGNPLLAHGVVECAGVPDNLLECFSITAAAKRVIGIVVKGNVEYRTKIEIKAENTQQSSSDVAMTADKIDIVLVAKLLCIRRLVADQPQAGYAAAFLVDGDDRFDFAQGAQIVDES